MYTLVEHSSVAETDLQTLSTDEIPFPEQTPAIMNARRAVSSDAVQRSWACRHLAALEGGIVDDNDSAPPTAGDVALMRVERTVFHKYLTTAENRRLRLYPGAQFLGVFGNRYASDAYEAEVQGTDDLSLLTAAGMVGTIKSSHREIAAPTRVSLRGFVHVAEGSRMNLKSQLFRPAAVRRAARNLILVVGTGMNAGKTTTAARLSHSLSKLGLKVGACKLTGSVSNRDQDELAAALSHQTVDFSDFGFPSTYLCSKEELIELFHAMIAQVMASSPDVVIMELADGLLQRETAMLLAEPEIKQAGRGVILSAESSLSALWGTARLQQLGHRVVAVSGKFTSSPLAMREYSENSAGIPAVSSAETGEALAATMSGFLRNG